MGTNQRWHEFQGSVNDVCVWCSPQCLTLGATSFCGHVKCFFASLARKQKEMLFFLRKRRGILLVLLWNVCQWLWETNMWKCLLLLKEGVELLKTRTIILFLHLLICSTVHPFSHPPTNSSIHCSIYLSTLPSINSSTHPSTHSFIQLSFPSYIHPSTHPPSRPFIYPSTTGWGPFFFASPGVNVCFQPCGNGQWLHLSELNFFSSSMRPCW